MNIFVGLLIGTGAGIISGMGIGGGIILIPALVIFLGIEQHTAQGVNLIFFIPTALAAVFIHIRNKNIVTKNICFIIISGVIGAFLGSSIAAFISSIHLRKMFAVFLFFIGGYEMYKGLKKSEECENA